MRDESDRERWDRKYAVREGPAHFRPRPLLTEHVQLLGGGRALDAACGFGGNALYLASLGYRVDAVDISGVALVQAQAEAARRGLPINFFQADLSRWWVQPARYDLIVTFFFLNRELMPDLAAGLQPGGLLFQANRNTRYLAVQPDFNPAFLVKPGELRQLAEDSGLEIRFYTDGTPDKPNTSQIIAQRPVRRLPKGPL